MTASGAPEGGTLPRSGRAGRTGAVDGPSAEQITALESAMLGILTEAKRAIHARAERIAPGMQRGVFNLFTQIARLGPISAGELAEHLSLDRSVISRSAKTLVTAGLIERRPNPDDGRRVVFSASAKGLELLTKARVAESARLHQEISNWRAADVVQLTELIERLTISRSSSQTAEFGADLCSPHRTHAAH